jgi:hypothetical protein
MAWEILARRESSNTLPEVVTNLDLPSVDPDKLALAQDTPTQDGLSGLCRTREGDNLIRGGDGPGELQLDVLSESGRVTLRSKI